jgi:molecular chaperone DnaJ
VITKPCATCKGEGRTTHERTLTVKIPAGISNGQRLRISGEGEGGTGGGPPGDLYVFIEVAEHPFFRRNGNDLACEIPLNFTTIALGGSIDVPTLDGTDSYKVPEGTQSGTTFRLRGKGMPDVSGRGRGDLYFTVQAVTPKKLTKEQRTLLDQLSKVLPAEKFEPRPRDAEEDEKNIFEKVKDIFG